MKILIIRLGRIGDMILSVPLFNQLGSNLPDVEIDVLASRDNYKILEYVDFVDNVYRWDKNPLKLVSLISKLRSKKYDVILEPKDHYSTESYYIASLIKAKRKIGFVKGGNSVFNEDISQYNSGLKHFQDKILSAIKAFGIEPNYEEHLPLFYPKSESYENLGNTVIVNISASKESKKLPSELTINIIEYLHSKSLEVLLLFSPEDQQIAEELSTKTKAKLANTKSIIDTFGLIDNAKAVITADTSIVHIASTYNKPLLVISKSIESELEKFAPKSKYSIVLKSTAEDGISVDRKRLTQAIDKLLQYTNQ